MRGKELLPADFIQIIIYIFLTIRQPIVPESCGFLTWPFNLRSHDFLLSLQAACGMKLRADDPVGMKTFIQSVQQRANELKASSENGQSNMSGKRVLLL